MGVLACNRKGCDRIMCDHTLNLSNQRFFYICDECLNELQAAKNTWPTSMTVNKLHDIIEAFMESEKNSYIKLNNHKEIEEEFQRILRRRS